MENRGGNRLSEGRPRKILLNLYSVNRLPKGSRKMEISSGIACLAFYAHVSAHLVVERNGRSGSCGARRWSCSLNSV